VGIIGQNGAGKSTLLKILSGTSQPNEGRYTVQGSVSALLELGLGFHPDFSGRANALMASRMMGLNNPESIALLHGIEEFSELGAYMDQPVRVYSTGMQVRLAFSTATAVRPEILIVDEALAVGDAYFQHKCIRRIRRFREQGTTLLFVSHDPGAIKTLCQRALLLDRGQLIKDGAPDAILDYYNALIAKKNLDAKIHQVETQHGKTRTRSGSGIARIKDVDMTTAAGKPARAFRTGEKALIRCAVEINQSLDNPTIGMLIRDRLGNDIYGTNTHHLKIVSGHWRAGERLIAQFRLPLNLGPAHYSISIAVHTFDTHLEENCDWLDQSIVFQVIPDKRPHFIGVAALFAEATIQRS
jgi:lipopolysaccharide transport system ATP-binding protein